MPIVWKLVRIACIVYVTLALALFLLQGRMVFFPIRGLSSTPAEVGLRFEEVRFESALGTELRGWFVPATDPRGITVLFCHGNAGNIGHRSESLLIFHQLGLNTFIFDYSGYGRSEGRPSEAATHADAEAAWRYLVDTRGLKPADIVLFGRSLGAAVAARLATGVDPRGLIVESAFTSVPDMASELYPWLPVRLLARIRYDTMDAVSRVTAPVLIVHSRDDELIPFAHGRAVFEAARSPKQLLEIRGSHNEGFLVSGEDYVAGLRRFLSLLGTP